MHISTNSRRGGLAKVLEAGALSTTSHSSHSSCSIKVYCDCNAVIDVKCVRNYSSHVVGPPLHFACLFFINSFSTSEGSLLDRVRTEQYSALIPKVAFGEEELPIDVTRELREVKSLV